MADLKAKLASLGHTEAKRGRKAGDVSPDTIARFNRLDTIADAISPDADGDRVLMDGDTLGVLTVADIGCESAPTMLAPTVKSWAKARGYEVACPATEGGIHFSVSGVPANDKPVANSRKRKA